MIQENSIFVAAILLLTPLVVAELSNENDSSQQLLEINNEQSSSSFITNEGNEEQSSSLLTSSLSSSSLSPSLSSSSLTPSSSFSSSSTSFSSSSGNVKPNNVYFFTVKDLDGNNVNLSKYKGRVLLIVNYAIACGFTVHNVNQLSKLVKKYGDKDLTVLMFPSNSFLQNFGGNKPGKFLKKYHPEFEVFSIIDVNGASEDPLYTYLKNILPNPKAWFNKSSIKWNFNKFLVDRDGIPVKRYSTTDTFTKIEKDILTLLNG